MEPNEGDTIEYEDFGGNKRVVKVTHVSHDIKNGLPGFDGIVTAGAEKGDSVWGYNQQITRILRKGE